eukprot:748346-Hanusia_phi.AAC.2
MPKSERRLLLFAVMVMSACAGKLVQGRDHYATLGVEQGCKEKEISRAYRKLAMMWHPDKCTDPEAKRKFTEIAEAYEILKDSRKREAYDRSLRGKGREAWGMGEFTSSMTRFEDADALFRENFGEQLWREWQPGMTLQSTIRRGGRSYSITIYPDGSSEEEESASDSRNLFYMKRSSAHGSMVAVHIDDFGSLAELLLPPALVRSWLIGPLIVSLFSWLPFLSFVGCCWCCCLRRSKQD